MHHVLWAIWPSIPIALNEGLAGYMSERVCKSLRCAGSAIEVLESFRRHRRKHDMVPNPATLQRLLSLDASAFEGPFSSMWYDYSYLLASFIDTGVSGGMLAVGRASRRFSSPSGMEILRSLLVRCPDIEERWCRWLQEEATRD